MNVDTTNSLELILMWQATILLIFLNISLIHNNKPHHWLKDFCIVQYYFSIDVPTNLKLSSALHHSLVPLNLYEEVLVN